MQKDNGLPLCSSTLQCLAEEISSRENNPPPPFPPNVKHPRERDEGETIEALRKLVSDLFDSAPVGYLYLSRCGVIRAVNRTGAELLGSERSPLITQRLDLFVSDETRPVFNDFLDRVFANDSRESCEVVFLREGHPLAVQLEATVCESGEECRAVVTDITGRRQAEEALRAARDEAERYRSEMAALMDAVPAVVLVAHDAECRHMSGSRFTQQMTGLPVSANFSKSAPDPEQPTNFVLMKEGREIPASQLPVQMAARGQEVRDYEYDRVFADGTTRTMFGNAVPLLDNSGRPRGAIGAFIDITERKRAEEAIGRRNALLTGINTIFKQALTCQAEQELADACLKVAGEITGSRFGCIGEIGADGMFHDIVISDTGWDACAMYDQDGNRRPPTIFHIRGLFGKVLLGGASFFTNAPASHPDSIGLPEGHPPLAAFLAVPLKSGDTTTGMIAVANRDGGYCHEEREFLEGLAPVIVEAFQRKRAEDALKKLNEELENQVAERTRELEFKNLILSTQNETSIEGILVVGEDQTIISHNRRFVELWDIRPELAESVDDGPVLELVASRVVDREGFLARVKELYDHREEKCREEILLKDGKVFDRYSAPMLGDDGTYFGKVWYFRDITERRQAERALREETVERLQAVEALREKEQMLIHQSRMAAMGEMIGNIAHQWRQPLNTLGLVIQQLPIFHDFGELTKEFLDGNVRQAMDLIQHMSKTIDDFRNYFRPDKEKVEFRVRETVATTLSLIQDSFRSHQISIEVVAPKDPVIYGYRNEFAQVLLNILNNARDALTERGVDDPKVRISTSTEDGRAVVTIADNAGGIPDEIRGKIFDPYFTTKGPQGGTGVGLFMSKAIIEKNMGGKLTARNIANGAEFRIQL